MTIQARLRIRRIARLVFGARIPRRLGIVRDEKVESAFHVLQVLAVGGEHRHVAIAAARTRSVVRPARLAPFQLGLNFASGRSMSSWILFTSFMFLRQIASRKASTDGKNFMLICSSMM